eukprot:TRINITY_DN3080_c0_g1_i12.p1 TRINITY_DN3080_c0_g1~~TRINITY_DN3080_c0_g1_i12.p1  ORF type:complete len:1662 (+),score=286.55 TRINITY_DN3080_c0_g1_i12:3808-8793(+)
MPRSPGGVRRRRWDTSARCCARRACLWSPPPTASSSSSGTSSSKWSALASPTVASTRARATAEAQSLSKGAPAANTCSWVSPAGATAARCRACRGCTPRRSRTLPGFNLCQQTCAGCASSSRSTPTDARCCGRSCAFAACAAHCDVFGLGDGACDAAACNTSDCAYDGGDCGVASSVLPPTSSDDDGASSGAAAAAAAVSWCLLVLFAAALLVGKKDEHGAGAGATDARSARALRRKVLWLAVGACAVAAVLVVALSLLALPDTFTCDASHGYYVRELEAGSVEPLAQPLLLCASADAGSVQVAVNGSGFVTVDGDLPAVWVQSTQADGVEVSDCHKVEHVWWHTVKQCRHAQFTVRGDASWSLTPVVQVVSPKPPKVLITKTARDPCVASGVAFVALPPPRVTGISPGVICRGTVHNVTLTGTNFFCGSYGGETFYPQTSLSSGTPLLSSCNAVNVSLLSTLTLQNCTDMMVTAQADALPEIVPLTVSFPRPENCSSTSDLQLRVVEPAHISSASPSYTCVRDGATVNLRGSGFLTMNYQSPTVVVGTVPTSVRYTSSCTTIAPYTQSCSSIALRLSAFAISAVQQPTITVIPIDLADCPSSATGVITLLPPPQIHSLLPAIVCAADNPQTVTVHGTFVAVDGVAPDVTIANGATVVTPTLSDCDATIGPAQQCATMQFDLPASTPCGDVAIAVTQACTTTRSGILTNVPSPVITNVTPAAACTSSAQVQLTLYGADFAVVGDVPPTLIVAGAPVSPVAMLECAEAGTNLQLCTRLEATLDLASLAGGGMPLVLQVLNNGACTSATAELPIMEPPAIAAVSPPELCDTIGGYVIIHGANISQSATLLLQCGNMSYAPSSLSVPNDTTAVARFNAGSVLAGIYDVLLANTPGCACIRTAGLHVHENGARVLFADPPQLYGNVSTLVTAFIVGLNNSDTPDTAVLSGGDGNVALPLTDWDADAGAATFTVPVGAVPAGAYTLLVHGPVSPCAATSRGVFLLAVLSDTTLVLSSAPTAASSMRHGVVLAVAASAAAFSPASLPALWLAPHGCLTCVATRLHGVTVTSATTLAVSLPSLLDVGAYDLVITCAEGLAGFLPVALSVTNTSVCRIDAVYPRAVGPSELAIGIAGAFSPAANYSASLQCRGGHNFSGLTLDAVSAASAQLELPRQLVAGDVCGVRLWDGVTACEYWSLAVTADGGELSQWQLGAPLRTPRCGHALVTAPVGSSTFVYAIGGSSGCKFPLVDPLATTEVLLVDPLSSTSSSWAYTSSLPEGITFAGVARVGSYIYLTGGYNGQQALATVYRAKILQESEIPVVSYSLSVSNATAFPVGVWAYQVSAGFPAEDESNPGGESLASPVIFIDVAVSNIAIRLSWSTIPSATIYYVYRSTASNSSAPTLVLLNSTTYTDYLDRGAAGAKEGREPQPRGALGNWRQMPSAMACPHYAHVTLPVASQSGLSSTLYTIGGGQGCEEEQVNVTLSYAYGTYETQQLGSWAAQVVTNSELRLPYQQGVVLDNTVMRGYASGDTVLLLGSAYNNASGNATSISTNHTYSHSSFQTWNSRSTSLARYGYCLLASGEANLYALGGASNSSAAESSALLMHMGTTPPPNEDPVTTYSEMSSSSLVVPVSHMGCTEVCGLMFVVGGVTTDGSATGTLQFTSG